MGPKATEFGEGHSRSSIKVPIESPYTSYTGFRLVPKSATFDYLERHNDRRRALSLRHEHASKVFVLTVNRSFDFSLTEIFVQKKKRH